MFISYLNNARKKHKRIENIIYLSIYTSIVISQRLVFITDYNGVKLITSTKNGFF